MTRKVLNRRRFVGLLAGTLLFAACANDRDDTQASADTSATESTAAIAGATEAPTTAPETAATTERIVSLSATATEMIYAIGAQDQLVAVDNYSNYPQEAADFATKIDAYEPSVEAISKLEPTVVLLAYDPGDLQKQLEKLGIKVWIGSAAATLDDSYVQITELGDLTGKAGAAATLVDTMKTEIKDVVTNAELPDAPASYYYELDNTFYSLTSNTFIGQLMSQFMLQNIADNAEAGNDYPQLSQESIISANPKIIFLADTKCCKQNAAALGERAGWKTIDAVKNGNVVELDDDVASRWGPRVVDLVKAIAAGIEKYVAGAKG